MTYLLFNFTQVSIFWLSLVLTILLLASFWDFKQQIIPNSLIYSGLIILSIYFLVFKNIEIFLNHLIFFVIAFMIFGLLFYKKWLGGGDAKLLMFISLAFPPENLLSVFLWIFITGGFYAILSLVILKSRKIPYAIPVFLGVLGYFISSFLLVK